MFNIPYAIRDYEVLVNDDYLYLDRTHQIPVMENLGRELLFLRPRRFGKSLWLSILANYYDVAKAEDFERLFGHLAIGENPTPLHNQFMIMRWDLSMVNAQGTREEIQRSLYNHINAQIAIFAEDYQEFLTSPIRINPDDGLTSLQSVAAAARRSPYKLYLLIDEYDNFANEIMMGGQGENRKRYDQLVSSEGLLKTLFKVVKALGSGAGLNRVFMTGVSPIVLNDVTSGANVAKNISWHPALNDLCGFREEEVQALVEPLVKQCGLPDEKAVEALDQMRIFYNGSCFVTRFPQNDASQIPRVYNPTLVFYFLEQLKEFCLYPEDMLDGNLAPDYQKLVYISGYSQGQHLIADALDETQQVTVPDLGNRWGVKDIMDPEQQYDRLASFLCYLGALTVSGRRSDANLILEIPNLVMRKLYAERIWHLTFSQADERREARDAADMLFINGDIEPLCGFVERHLLKVYDNRDYRHVNELTIKTLFIALLHHKNLYIMDSEPAIQRRYGDLILMIRPEMRHYDVQDILIEFKYVPLKDREEDGYSYSGQAIQKQSWEELVNRAALKLRTYVVVAVGVDRLLCEEVVSG